MSIFDRLFELRIANKEKYAELFRNTVESVRKGTFNFSQREVVGDGHRMIQDESGSGNCFVYIVPNEAWNLFQEMKNNVGEQPLGFSVLAGKFNEREVRVCCFGIECNRHFVDLEDDPDYVEITATQYSRIRKLILAKLTQNV